MFRSFWGNVSNNCPIFHLQYKNSLFWLAFSHKSGRMCVGYEADMAALSLACCSPGSEVTAAWKSAEWCWANSFISMAKEFWVTVEERQKRSWGMTRKHWRQMIDDYQQCFNRMLMRGLCRDWLGCSMRGNVQQGVSTVLCFLFVFPITLDVQRALKLKSLSIQFTLDDTVSAV